MKILVIFFFSCFSALPFGKVVKHKMVIIHPNKSFQNYEHFKRLTLSSPDAYVEYISGFEFEWGYTYQLLVKETELLPLSDGTRLQHELVKVISKTKVPDSTQFRLFLDVNLYYYEVDSSEIETSKTLIQKNDSTYLYFEEVQIIVPTHLTTQFKSIVDGATKKVGTFEFVDRKRIRLVQL